MALMKWTQEDYGLTDEIFNEQHQELSSQVNALNMLVSEGERPEIGNRLYRMQEKGNEDLIYISVVL
jgi:hypothetical protein